MAAGQGSSTAASAPSHRLVGETSVGLAPNSLNLAKHQVSFEEASTALADTLAATAADPDHSQGESRWVMFGMSEQGRLLAVAHTEERDAIRIISARLATKAERKLYEEG